MPPITIVFISTGLAAWANGMYFLGMGADKQEGAKDPLVSVGWVSLTAGIVDLLAALYILTLASDATTLLAGLITFYGVFFVLLGMTEITGLDLRPVGNLALAVAVVPLFWWSQFEGSWMFQSILVVWAVAFLAIAATVNGKFSGKLLGAILLLGVAIYSFFVPIIILATGNTIP